MLQLVHALVFALVAVFGIASGARASEAKTALRAFSEAGHDRVGAFGAEAHGTRQQSRAFATAIASDSLHAARGGAVTAGGTATAANGVRLAKQLASEAGSAELLAGGGKVMAGAGTKTPIRDVGRLVAEHGGQAGDWAKVTSTTHKIVNGVTVEVHGYMNMATRAVVELKSKVGLWSP